MFAQQGFNCAEINSMQHQLKRRMCSTIVTSLPLSQVHQAARRHISSSGQTPTSCWTLWQPALQRRRRQVRTATVTPRRGPPSEPASTPTTARCQRSQPASRRGGSIRCWLSCKLLRVQHSATLINFFVMGRAGDIVLPAGEHCMLRYKHCTVAGHPAGQSVQHIRGLGRLRVRRPGHPHQRPGRHEPSL
jgi:hypothetical protein